MTAATSATREQNIQQIRRMFDDVKPQHLTDDELASMVEVIKPAWDRMQEPMPGVVYLDSVRSRQRR